MLFRTIPLFAHGWARIKFNPSRLRQERSPQGSNMQGSIAILKFNINIRAVVYTSCKRSSIILKNKRKYFCNFFLHQIGKYAVQRNARVLNFPTFFGCISMFFHQRYSIIKHRQIYYISSYLICLIKRDHFYLVQESRFQTKSVFFNKSNRERYPNVLVSFPERYRNVCPFVFDITCQKSANYFEHLCFYAFCND